MIELNRPDTYNPTQPCCGVTAIAIFTGAKFHEVQDYLCQFFAPGWKGGTNHITQVKAMKRFNKGRTVACGMKQKMTLKRFVEDEAREDVAYCIRTTKHQQVLLNGYVADQSGVYHISEYWGRNKYCVHFWAKSV